MRALSIAATGMSAQQTNVEVIANNIANSNTTAFKRSQAQFSDLIYQAERAAGVPNQGNSASSAIPESSQVGLGVQLSAIVSLNTQGPITKTGNTLDLAINGRGWFQVSGRTTKRCTRGRVVQQECAGTAGNTGRIFGSPQHHFPNGYCRHPN